MPLWPGLLRVANAVIVILSLTCRSPEIPKRLMGRKYRVCGGAAAQGVPHALKAELFRLYTFAARQLGVERGLGGRCRIAFVAPA